MKKNISYLHVRGKRETANGKPRFAVMRKRKINVNLKVSILPMKTDEGMNGPYP